MKKPKIPDWSGQPCIVIGSGPSLAWDNYADVDLVKKSGIKTIAVNTTWEKVKFCDVIYAGDGAWWKYNQSSINIPAVRFTSFRAAERIYGCHYTPTVTKKGYNSGANALFVAAKILRANPVLLLGFDCSTRHGVHHHENHKNTSNPTRDRAERWKPQFKEAVSRSKNTRFINCSRYSEIKFIKKADLQRTLIDLGLLPK